MIIINKYEEEYDDGFDNPFELGFDLSCNNIDSLTINETMDKSFMDLLNDKKLFLECMKDDIDTRKDLSFSEEDKINYKESLNSWNYYLDNFDNILEKTDKILFNCSEDEVLEYLNKYEILKDKIIVINECYYLSDTNKILELGKKFNGYNIRINLVGNRDSVSINTAIKTIKLIKKQSNEIKKLKLSPLESMMITYDIVRDRVYKEAEESNKVSLSRDLSDVLFNDNIVCAGYSQIFTSILSELGYDVYNVFLNEKSNEPGHERNAVYVKDTKYNVEGLYYFDTTWDSKSKENDNSFLNRYLFFAKTRDEIEEIEKKYNINYKYMGSERYSKNIIKDLEKYIKENDNINYNITLNTINNLASLMKKEKINKGESIFYLNIKEAKEAVVKAEEIIKDLNRPIYAETFIDLIMNVRTIEKKYDPQRFLFNPDTIYKICINSNWKFKNGTNNMKNDFYNYFKEKKYFERVFAELLFGEYDLNNKKIKKI